MQERDPRHEELLRLKREGRLTPPLAGILRAWELKERMEAQIAVTPDFLRQSFNC